MKEKMDKLDFIEINNFALQETLLKKISHIIGESIF